MTTLPKPRPCSQKWLHMRPIDKGRLCGQCEKKIYDFSAMSWPEIARTQAAQGNTLCGMYTSAQLAHWGQIPPNACAQLLTAATLALTLSSLPVAAQSQTASASSTELTVRGTVLSTPDGGKAKPVPYATVLLAGTSIGTTADKLGQYELTIPTPSNQADSTTMLFSNVGYITSRLVLPLQTRGMFQQDIYLTENTNVDIFYVLEPSLIEQIRWTLKRWFVRDKD